MNRTRVKICGITRPEDAVAATESGADAIGLVFWPGSKRAIDADRAAMIVSTLPPSVAIVGVFVDPSLDDVMRISDGVGITAAQVCGNRNDQDWSQLPRTLKIIRALAITVDSIPSALARIVGVSDYLVDNGIAGHPGGTGQAYDWSLANRIKPFGRVWLAGGLTPQNVSDAIAVARPHAVDVSGGVEIAPGIKSIELIRSFIEAVHRADYALAKGEKSAH